MKKAIIAAMFIVGLAGVTFAQQTPKKETPPTKKEAPKTEKREEKKESPKTEKKETVKHHAKRHHVAKKKTDGTK